MNPDHFPTLSFDGKGVNGRDQYRERIATFTNDSAARQFGPLFAAAPELRDVLRAAVAFVELHTGDGVREQPPAWAVGENGEFDAEVIAARARELLRGLAP